ADHGYLALGLFLALLLLTWWRAGRVARAARLREDQEWIAQLAAMIQVSLGAYMVAGAALSMAYWDVAYILVALVSVLRRLLAEATTPPVASPAGDPDSRRPGDPYGRPLRRAAQAVRRGANS